MSGWAIDPIAVDEIMTAVGELRPDLDAAVSDYRVETSLSYLQWGRVLAMDVQTAVLNLLADQRARLTNIATRVEAGRVGASLAAAAYDGSADDMCEELQTEMVATAASGDSGYV